MAFVILGAGPAGVVAADTLRDTVPDAEIVLVGGEPEPPYSRMAIPYVLTGNIEEAGTYLHKSPSYYEDRRIRYVRSPAEAVDVAGNSVKLADGGTLAYDKLLVATGASPIKPPVPGLDLPGVHHCWTLDDIRRIKGLAASGASVVLVGAGFIGSIILESLLARGVQLTVVEAGDRMVPRMMDQTAGNLIKAWCETKGATVHTSTMVTEIASADAGRLTVSLNNGESVEADLAVIAAGVKPNIGFLDGSGIKVDDGIVVDEYLRSSANNIYAAGDCARGPDFSGGWSVHAIQPTATEHGRVAALNMAGQATRYQGSLSMNVLDTAGLISTSFGLWDGVEGGDKAEIVDERNFRYIRLSFEGDRLVGAQTLGRTDQVGVLRGLIQSRIALGPWKQRLMDDPARYMDAYIACTRMM